MATLIKDVKLENIPTEVLFEKHQDFLQSYEKDENNYEYGMTDYLRMSGMYWGLTALELMHLKTDNKKVVDFIVKCQDSETGGISGCIDHDPHMLHTLSAIQILIMMDQINAIDVKGVVKYVVSNQQPDGSFTGDKWGEVDTRFSFTAVATLSLLNRLDAIDVKKAVEFVQTCMNFDGGFGSRPMSESHAGLIYCCLGFLSITNRLDIVEQDTLAWWLCERQLPSGGLNGRPEKLPDVCYSWWVLSSLTLLGRLHWINKEAIKNYILACQDTESGGFSDRPGNVADPYHTLFGLAALSLLGDEKVKSVNPTYCMPQIVIDRLGLRPQILLSMDKQRSYGFVIYKNVNKDIEYLLLKSSKKSGQWTPPRGRAKQGETELDAAYRENQEETKLRKEDLKLENFSKCFTYCPKKKTKTLLYWLVELVNYEREIAISREHQEYNWATLDKAFTLCDLEHIKLLKECDEYIRCKR